MARWMFFVVMGCSPVASQPHQQAPVPPGFDPFVVGEMIAGEPFRVTLADRSPGERVFFGVSSTTGTLCPPPLGGGCLDIGPQVTLLGRAVVGGDGYATLAGTVPAVPDGRDLYFQGAVFDANGVVETTDVVLRTTGFDPCPLVFDEVCAVDGSSQINACFSDALGWPVQVDGPCP